MNQKKSKILLVTTVDMTFEYILKEQPKFLSKHFSVLIGSSGRKSLKKIAQKEKVQFINIPMVRNINPFFDIFSIIKLIICLIKEKPDIIHSFTPKAGLICAISGKLVGVPKRLHTFTGLIFPYKKLFFQLLLSKIDSLICYLITDVIAEGKGVKKQLLDFNITKKQIHIIGNGNIAGVDTQYFSPKKNIQNNIIHDIKNKFSIIEKSFTFIFVGRLNKDKGLIELVKAFSKIKIKKINLILLGKFETNKFKLELKKLIKESDNKIWLENWKDDIRPYLFIADCFMLPSYREGFPNVLLQAGAMMLPSIVTNVPGSNEIIKNKYNGWICSPKSSSELYKKMNMVILLSQTQLDKIGNQARKNIEEKYEKNNYQNLLIKFYKQLESI